MTKVAGNAWRILVVEDVQETREAIEALLRKDDYQVDAAKDEGDALERARWNRPDLILVSLGGTADAILATAQTIRARAGLTSHVPIVIFPISTVQEGEEREIKGNVYLTVPDNFNQLRALLARVLQDTSRTQ
jgi:CheY-like chemotaxis protein